MGFANSLIINGGPEKRYVPRTETRGSRPNFPLTRGDMLALGAPCQQEPNESWATRPEQDANSFGHELAKLTHSGAGRLWARIS